MCNSSVFKQLIPSTVLSHVLEKVQQEPFSLPAVGKLNIIFCIICPLYSLIEIEDGFCGYTLNDKKEHEAGYDAYITGLCLLGMWNYLGEYFVIKN